MVLSAAISPAWSLNKKYAVTIFEEHPVRGSHKRTIQFGDSRYEDYTMHKDDERKADYIARHKPNEDWTDIHSPEFWSRWLLWNKKTLEESAADITNARKMEIDILV